MKLFSARSVLSVFYYLIAIDGEISNDELEKFDEIGKEIDPDNYVSYKECLIEECKKQINSIKDEEDYYDILLESVDKALMDKNSEDINIPSRMLVWNMLVIAFSNKKYEKTERKLIKHIVRFAEIDENVFVQMEEFIKTSASVEGELEWIKHSDKPYGEVAPIVSELEKRLANIIICAKLLIDDEMNQTKIEAVEIKPSVFEGVKDKTGKLLSDTKDKISETATPIVKDIKNQTAKLFGNIKSKIKTKSENKTDEKVKNTDEQKGEN